MCHFWDVVKTKISLNCIKRPSPYRAVNSIAGIQTSQLMLYREIIAVCSQIHTKHTNILRRHKVKLLNVKLVVYIETIRCKRVVTIYRV